MLKPTSKLRKAFEAPAGELDFIYRPIEARSLSHARNLAIAEAAHPTILYIDADAVAAPGWAATLAAVLDAPDVGVAGGRIVPRWHARPLWTARASVVLDQYSVLDLGPGRVDVAKFVGASFGLRRDRLGDEARFDPGLGRRDGRLFGGEDSDLCRRAQAMGLRIVYDGAAVIEHQVMPERIRHAWVLKRMYYAGLGRATQGGPPAPSRSPGLWDWLALPLILPPYIAGYVAGRLG